MTTEGESTGETAPVNRGRTWWLTAGLVAVVAFLPFLRGVAGGASFHFRDLGRYFFPIRQFIADGLRQGELRFWNPFVHEGEPLLMAPISYLPDLLQALWPTEAGISLLLALHVPFAALAMLLLLRQLGLCASAAASGALAYALGGFCLSSLNLYVHLQAMAWGPLVVWAVGGAAAGAGREVARGALVIGLALSTTGVEMVGLALVIAVLVMLPLRPGWAWGRAGASVSTGAALAAVPLVVLFGAVGVSARGEGLSTASVLTYSVHPVSLLQTVIGNLHGDLSSLFDRYWGARFSASFPYYLSLYLGPTLVCLAATGAAVCRGRSLRWCLIAFGGLWLSLGYWGGWGLLLDSVPFLRVARFPVKAFFLVHFAAAVLGALGLEAISRARGRAVGVFSVMSLALGGWLACAPLLARLAPGVTQRLQEGLFLSGVAPERRAELLALILGDASLGGVVCLTAGAMGVLAWSGRLQVRRASLAVASLMVADIVRTGAGLNPMAPPAVASALSPEVRDVLDALKKDGGRVFTCDLDSSRTYHGLFREVRRDRDLWALAAFQDSLTPYSNVRSALPTALSRDLTGMAPREPQLALPRGACATPEAVVERAREAGVSHVIAPVALAASGLTLERALVSARAAPLALYVHRLSHPLPLRAVATTVVPVRTAAEARRVAPPGSQLAGTVAVEGETPELRGARGRILSVTESADRIELLVEADRRTVVVVRDAFAAGWSATANGAAVPVWRANGRHRAVPVGPGRTRVVLSYRPPGLRLALLLTGLALGVTIVLWCLPVWRRSAGGQG